MLHQDPFTEILARLPTKVLVRSRLVSLEFNTLASKELFSRKVKYREAFFFQKQFLRQWRHSHKAVIPSALLLTALQHDFFNDEDHINGLQTIASWEGIHFEIEDDVVLKKIAELKAEKPEWPGSIITTLGAFFLYVKSSALRKQILDAITGFSVGKNWSISSEACLSEIVIASENIFPYLALPEERKQILEDLINIFGAEPLSMRPEYMSSMGRIFTHSRSAEERNQIWDVLESWMYNSYYGKKLPFVLGNMYLDLTPDERKQRLNAFIDMAKGNIGEDHPHFLRALLEVFEKEYSHLESPKKRKKALDRKIVDTKKNIRTMAAHILKNIYPYLPSAEERKTVLVVIIDMFNVEDIFVLKEALKVIKEIFPQIKSIDERTQLLDIFWRRLSKERLSKLLKSRLDEEHVWPEAFKAVVGMFPYLKSPDERKQALSIVLEKKEVTDSINIAWEFLRALEKIFPDLTSADERQQIISALIEKTKVQTCDRKTYKSLVNIYQHVAPAEELEEHKQVWENVRKRIKQTEIVASLDELLALLEKGIGYEQRYTVLRDLKDRFPQLSASERQRVLMILLNIQGRDTRRDALDALGALLLCKGMEVSPVLLDLFPCYMSADDAKKILSRLIVAGKCTTAHLEAINIIQYSYGTLLLNQSKWVAQIHNKIHEKFAAPSISRHAAFFVTEQSASQSQKPEEVKSEGFGLR